MSRSVLFLSVLSFHLVWADRPNIVFILADDLGWNDVGFHGSNFIPTPNIDALAYTGIILDKYYVTPICTPSRSALMTGKYPIHTGMQHGVLKYAEPRGLPLNEKLLPQYLKEIGYRTHIVGKWHLGMYKKDYTPIYRGFDSHLGFWGGRIDYYDHSSEEYNQWGLDMRRGMEPAWDLHGQYITDLFTKESVKIIKNHDVESPLFLYLAHGATHSANPYDPLQISNSDPPPHMCNSSSYLRSRFAGMVKRLDESVRKVMDALDQKGMLHNTIIIFSSDNGGPAAGFNLNYASNWPLRGVKNTNFEGGVRATGLIWSPLLTMEGRVSKQMMHITDWLPTLLTAAGYNSTSLGHLDGIDMWDTLRTQTESKRNVILHNIDDIYGTSAITIGSWKLMQGSTYGAQWNSWYGPAERDWYYNTNKIEHSDTGKLLSRIGYNLNADDIISLREQTKFECPERNESLPLCAPVKSPCLVNLEMDPCERNNLASVHPEIMQMLQYALDEFNQTAMKPGNRPLDPRSNPVNWDHVWTNYGDHLKDYLDE